MMSATCRRLSVGLVMISLTASCDRSPSVGRSTSPGAERPQQQAASRSIVYDESADARKDIEKAIAAARADGKRVLLVFGANWCPDCVVLDKRFHEPPVGPVVDANFHVVKIDIGPGDRAKNQDVAEEYGIPLDRGVPAVAVLASDGALLHAQRDGEWAPHGLSAAAVVEFLDRWKPAGR